MKKIIFVLAVFSLFVFPFFAEKKTSKNEKQEKITPIKIPPRPAPEKVETDNIIINDDNVKVRVKTSVDRNLLEENQSPFYKPRNFLDFNSRRDGPDPVFPSNDEFSAEIQFQF